MVVLSTECEVERLFSRLHGVDPSWRVVTPDVAALLDGASPETLTQFADGGVLTDLFLSRACLRSIPSAVGRMHALLLLESQAISRRLGLSPDDADEIHQRALLRLWVAEPPRTPRLVSYRGEGRLGAFVGRCIAHVAADWLESRKRLSTEGLEGVRLLAPDLENKTARLEFRDRFQKALKVALGTLSERDRSLLRLHHVNHLATSQVAALHGVHRVTVFRWLADIHRSLEHSVRRQLKLSEGLATSEFRSVARELHSELSFNLSRVLSV